MVSAGWACLVEADDFRLEQIGYQTAAPIAFAALLIAAKPAPTASDWALTLPPVGETRQWRFAVGYLLRRNDSCLRGRAEDSLLRRNSRVCSGDSPTR